MSTRVASIFASIGLDAKDFEKGHATVSGSIGNIVSKLGSIHPAAAVAMAGLAALGKFMQESAILADEAARVHARTEAVIRATGGAAGMSAKDIADLSNEMMRLTGIDDEAAESASAVMLTFRNVGKDIFPDAMKAAASMAAVLGTDLTGATLQLGKALNDPIRGVTALRRAGVSFSEEQQREIKNFVEMNDLASAQAVVMAEVNAEFGDAAAAMHDAGNRSEDAKNAIENLKEELGAGLLPIQQQVNEAIEKGATALTEYIQQNKLENDILEETNALLADQGLSTKENLMHMNKMGIQHEKLTVASRSQADAARYQAEQNIAARDAISGAGSAAGEAALQYDDLLKTTMDIAGGVQRYRQQIAELTAERTTAMQAAIEDGYVTEEERARIDQLGEAISASRAELVLWSKQFVLSMLQTKAAAEDGVSKEEFDFIMQAGQDMGLIDEDIANMATSAVEAMDNLDFKNLEKINSLWQTFLATPDEVTKTVIWNEEGSSDFQNNTSENAQSNQSSDFASSGKPKKGGGVTIENYGTINFPQGAYNLVWTDQGLLVQ